MNNTLLVSVTSLDDNHFVARFIKAVWRIRMATGQHGTQIRGFGGSRRLLELGRMVMELTTTAIHSVLDSLEEVLVREGFKNLSHGIRP